jgi:hypothetical protein
MEENMLIVNIGSQGFSKTRNGDKGTVLESKSFPPNIPVECSKEMALGLLKKYNNPTMAIIMRSAEGFSLADNPTVPIVDSEDIRNAETAASEEAEEKIANDDPMTGYQKSMKRKRGRPGKR